MGRSEGNALVPAEYLEFIAGERVSPKTREVLEARMEAPAAVMGVLNKLQVETLRAMLACVIPQQEPALDLTAYVLERLDKGKGDGWRYDVLPEDCQAYREGLDRLATLGFVAADREHQVGLLKELESGELRGARWFEEVRGDATAAYMAHPATLARLGYSGFGVGGANTKYKGFVTLGPNETEQWEPRAAAEKAR